MKKHSFLTLVFYVAGILLALVFTGFGIHILKLSYAMDHPGYFIIFFFTSNFIILLSFTVFIALGYRFYRYLRPLPEEAEPSSEDSENG